MMKHCIWCKKQEGATFQKVAHTIPQSLGGKGICTNVCDTCNLFFGSHQKGLPSVETILKETFGITRARFLHENDEIGKNKALPKFSSLYFNVDFKKGNASLKNGYQLKKGFQEGVGRQMKKGIYKIFLEETERQFRNAHETKYDFIREFARYDFGDYPLFYFERKYGVYPIALNWIKNPVIHLRKEEKMKYLVDTAAFCEFEILGHVFALATSKLWHLDFDRYRRTTEEAKKTIFHRWWPVKNFNDVDLALALLDNHYHGGVTEYAIIDSAL